MAAPRLQCEAFNLHWIVPLIVAKPIKPLMMVVQRAAFVRFAPDFKVRAVNASEVPRMHATAYRRSIMALDIARA